MMPTKEEIRKAIHSKERKVDCWEDVALINVAKSLLLVEGLPEEKDEIIKQDKSVSIEQLENILKYKSIEILPDGTVRDNEAVKINAVLRECKAV